MKRKQEMEAKPQDERYMATASPVLLFNSWHDFSFLLLYLAIVPWKEQLQSSEGEDDLRSPTVRDSPQ